MSIYLGNLEVGVTLLNDAKPIGLDEICNHTFASGDVTYNGERIYPYTFARTPITSFTGPNVKRFNNTLDPTTDGNGGTVFYGCTGLTSVTFPELLNLGSAGGSQFQECSSLILTSTSFPKLKSFGSGGYTFYKCTGLVTIDSTVFPSLTTFNAGGYQFAQCTSLTSVNIPNLTTFGGTGHQFDGCTSLVTIDFPKLTSLGNGGYQFQNCKALKNINLPLLNTDPGSYTFSGCTALEHVFLPKFTFGNRQYVFRNCSNLLTAVFPGIGISANTMNGYCFQNCSKLTAIDFGKISAIRGNEFSGCAALNVLVLRHTTMVTLANVSAFTNTPFASGKAGGTIYVPSALIDTYKAGTNWVTILGYGDGEQNHIEAIEDSIYATQYVDGTSIA